jgi:hypothetical protein
MKFMKTYLIITGIGAFIALTIPGIVSIGLWFGIWPGLILLVMPTAFMYGAVFAAAKLVLARFVYGPPLIISSVIATMAIFFAVPQYGLSLGRAAYQSAKQENVIAQQPIIFEGDILVENVGGDCDSICGAFLRTDGVTSVRMGSVRNGYLTYRIGPINSVGKKVQATGFGLLENNGFNKSALLQDQPALEADWNLRLANGKALIATDDTPQANFTVLIERGPIEPKPDDILPENWSFLPTVPERESLTVTSRSGDVLLRQSVVQVDAPMAPLLFTLSGRDGRRPDYLGWALQSLGDGKADRHNCLMISLFGGTKQERMDCLPINRRNIVTAALLVDTNIARGVDQEAVVAAARSELLRALLDPNRPASDPAFTLANQWTLSFENQKGPLSPEDRKLLAMVMDDQRVTYPEGISSIMRLVEGEAFDLRRLAVRRFRLEPNSGFASQWLNVFISNLPEGAFHELLPEERQILSVVKTAVLAQALIRRQSDRGIEAIPDLLRLLEELLFFERDPDTNGPYPGPAIDAVRQALIAIGSKASPALPEIERLLDAYKLRNPDFRIEKQQWNVLLVALGKPVEGLDKPEHVPGTEEEYRVNLKKQVLWLAEKRRNKLP